MGIDDKKLDMGALYDRTINNKPFIQPDTKCACFVCGKVFTGADITKYESEFPPFAPAETATCPYCGDTTVLPETALPNGAKITGEVVKEMQRSFGIDA